VAAFENHAALWRSAAAHNTDFENKDAILWAEVLIYLI
jgi:hypothetical protein